MAGPGRWLAAWALLWAAAAARAPGSGASADANRLLEDVMAPYNRLVRPVQNNSERVVVWLSLELSQLIDVNLKEQIMETNIWLKQEWYDHKLKWDPSEYGGIEDMSVPAEQIWLPDIVLYNSAEGYFAVSIMTRAQVHFDGRVNWNPPAIFRSSCHIDITHFPFDTQNCKLKFGSWTFGPLLDLRHRNETEGPIERGIELKNYHQNVEWDIMEASARRNVELYSCCPNDPYLDVTFYLVLRRKPLFYTINLIVPCIVITALSLLVFFLPSDSGEKVTLTISILVSLIFFLSVLIETIPSTSLAMPLLGKYLVFTMVLITLSVCATVCVLNIHFRTPSTHDMSPWIKRWFIHILPKYLLLNTTHSQQSSLLPEHLIYPPNQAYIVSQQQQAAGYSPSDSPPKLALNHTATASQVAHNQRPHQLDADQLHQHNHLAPANTGHEPPTAGSLFLPYLQSKAARRLQMQRSRSSDRDQKSTSDLVWTTSSMMMNHYCDNKWVGGQKAGKKPAPNSGHAKEAKKESLRALFWSAAGKKRQQVEKEKKRKRSDSTSARNNYELYQQSSSSIENDYRHHTHFLARASVCQTNLWRMGPTRHCSQVAPLDYPTYYRPIQPAATSRPLNSAAGCLQQQQLPGAGSTSSAPAPPLHFNSQLLYHPNLHQCQRHQQAAPIDSRSMAGGGGGKTIPKRGAVGALVSGSAASACQMSSSSSLPLRPRHQVGPLKVASGASIRPKSGGAPGPRHQPASATAREHLAPRPAISSLESTTNFSWIKDAAGDDLTLQTGEYQQQQQQKQKEQHHHQHYRQQMLLLSQVPQANHAANPPAAPINSASLHSSMQSRCGVNATGPMNSQKQQHQPSSGGPGINSSCSIFKGSHQSLATSGGGLYTQLPMGFHLHQHPALTSGSVCGEARFVDSKSPAPVSDKLLWQNDDIEFPPPPSFDCDLLLNSHQHRPAQCHMPRSRSTDHRLHSASLATYYRPVNARAAGLLTPTGQPDTGRPINWQNHHSLGRALGQAYLQRLQPDCSASLESSNKHPERMSRFAMHEAQHRQSSRQRSQMPPDCPSDAQGRLGSQSCSMPRSKSQSSLERLVRSAGAAPAPSSPQVVCCQQRPQLLDHQQPCSLYHQQRNRSCTLQARSHNLVPVASGADNQGSLGGGGGGGSGGGVCVCASSSLAPAATMPKPRAVAVQSGELTRFSQELDKAIENTMFIAQHIDNLDEFESVKENWKYIAMVIDRIFLIVFLVAGFLGSVVIFAMVPWSYYTRHSPIDLHLAHLNALNLTGADFYYKSCP